MRLGALRSEARGDRIGWRAQQRRGAAVQRGSQHHAVASQCLQFAEERLEIGADRAGDVPQDD